MDERLRFVARLLDGEKMAALCREFDVSRKTGYKIFQRYKDCGLEGLSDRSRRPYRQANQLPLQVQTHLTNNVRRIEMHSIQGPSSTLSGHTPYSNADGQRTKLASTE